VLPSRPRLISWNPESLGHAGTSIGDAGQRIYDTVRHLDDGCDRMSEARTWSGEAHRAATEMFARATTKSSRFLDYAAAVADALTTGGATIGKARTDLLCEVETVERGGRHDGGARSRPAEASRGCSK
jgi:uncharacterized protein YukE